MNPRILLADDEIPFRDMLRRVLEVAGYRVDEAGDYLSAVALLKQQNYDIILSDNRMPDDTGVGAAGGIRLLKYVREFAPGTPVVMMTGHATIDNSIQAMKLGAFDYLLKPFTIDELQQTLSRILDFRSFINPQEAIDHYCSLHDEYVKIIGSSTMSAEEQHRLLRSIGAKFDLFFQQQKKLEGIILDQRDALSNIAMHACMLTEQVAEGDLSQAETHLETICKLAERRL